MPDQTWKEKYGPVIFKVVQYVVMAALGALATWLGVSPAVVEKIVEVEKPILSDGSDYAPTFGWSKDKAQIDINLDEERTLHFHNTPAGRAVLGDEDRFLWQAVRKVNNKGPPWYPNVNQLSVGCCVGCGWKHSVDVVQATQILGGRLADWKPVSVEVIYGGSRVEIGGERLSGDGSVGAWAAKWVKDYGVVPMEKFPEADLSKFSPSRARTFGRTGVPKGLEKLARDHPVKSTALVRTWADVKRALLQGYPVAVCSDQGFRMERDQDGFCRASGTWPHCMAIIGYRKGPKEGAFILNSWGDNAHTGPVYPADMPVAGFWAEPSVIDGMVRQGDSFALSDIAGFPARRVPDDWFILAPAPRRDLLALEWRLAP